MKRYQVENNTALAKQTREVREHNDDSKNSTFSADIHNSKRKRGRETKQKIFLLVEGSQPDGLTLGELVEATKKVFPPAGLHRDRVADICKEYIIKGLFVQVPKEKGKFGRYLLGPNAYGDPRLAAFYLQRKIMDPRTFYYKLGEAIRFSSKFSNLSNKKGWLQSPDHEEYVRKSANKNEEFDQQYLFEYSLKLGAIIIYQLIQAVRHAEASPLLTTTNKDDFVLKWIENALMPMSIVQTFGRLPPVYKRLAKPRQEENPSEDKSLGWIELEKEGIEELENIFRTTFGGSFFQELERIRLASIPRDLYEHKHRISESERIEQLRREDPDHINCGGVAEPRSIKQLGVLSNNNGQSVKIYSRGQDVQSIKRCSKCGRRIVMRWMTPRIS